MVTAKNPTGMLRILRNRLTMIPQNPAITEPTKGETRTIAASRIALAVGFPTRIIPP